jgi:murein DD-endopeptidase MepM/ murein hydrolase activator NlpD
VRCSSPISYGHVHHDYPATDIFAATGCLVVSPVDGIIDEVTVVDTWDPKTNTGASRGGLSFSVVGFDGVRYYGSHLSVLAAGIGPGVRVRAGQAVGKVGKSGDARDVTSHLHFGISWPTGPGVWWVRRGEVYPWPYLDAWRKGIMKSPAAAVAAKHKQVGNRGCTVDC